MQSCGGGEKQRSRSIAIEAPGAWRAKRLTLADVDDNEEEDDEWQDGVDRVDEVMSAMIVMMLLP